jgi:hypothetical protein
VRKRIFYFALLLLICCAQPAKADWFVDLTNGIQTNSPAAWEGQKRGYFTGGGFSLRTQTSREPLLNLQAPRISAGCGGIDVFWGSFSYLNPEYLIQAFQNIMSAAPAYAFKLALQQLCDPCDDVMSALQQMAQAINNIALDECGSAQALVNLGGDAIASMLSMDSQTSSSAFGNWVSDKANKLASGFQAFNDEVRKLQNWQFCGGFANHEDYDRCARFVNMEGSLWEKAKESDRTSTNKPDEEFFRLARALFGEMIITAGQKGDKDNKSTTMYKVEYHAPCPTTTANLVIRSMLGNLVAKPGTETATTPNSATPSGEQSDALVSTAPSGPTDTYENDSRIGFRDVILTDGKVTGITGCLVQAMPESLQVYKRAETAISAIGYAMQHNPQMTLADETIEVVLQSRLPVYQIINSLAYRGFYGGVLTADEADALIKLTAIGYTQFLMEEFAGKAEGILDQAYLQLTTSQTAAPIDPAQLETGYSAIKKRLALFRAEMIESFRDVHQLYMTTFKQALEFSQLRDYYQNILKNRGMASAMGL